MTNYKYYNYTDLGITSDYLPFNTHLLIETNSLGTLYLVNSDDQTKLYKTTDKGANWSLIETRTRKIQACWHDRVAGIIYLVDCDQNDTQLTAWFLTLADDSITEMGTYSSTAVHAHDIWKIGSDFFITAFAEVATVKKLHILKWVDPNWVVRDNNEAFLDIGYMSEVTYPGGTVPTFIIEDSTDHVEIWVFDDSYPDFYHIIDVGSNLNLPTWNMRAIAVVPSTNPIFHFVLYDTSDSKYYLYQYTLGNVTKKGEYNLVLMLDRNTDSTADPPNNLEKGFHVSEDKIYQIPENYSGRLNLISVFPFTGTIVAITDHFVIDSGKKMYERVDVMDYITRLEITHDKEDYPTAKGMLRRDKITIAKNLFMQVIGKYSANDSNRIFKGTYNFRDEDVGTSGTDIEFVDSATLYDGACVIVSDWQGHRKVLRLQDDATAAEDPFFYHSETQATAGTREFRIGTNDVTQNWDYKYYENGNDYIIRLRITGSKFYYRDSLDAYQEIQAVANNIFYHIKVVWRADNTFDVWVDGILKVDNVATNNNQVSGIDRFYMQGYGDSTAYLYLDAYGDPTNDADYAVGDNQYIEEGEPNRVIFEGKVQNKDGKLHQTFDCIGLGVEMDAVEPSGTKSGRTDEIIVDINDDGDITYINNGTLSVGQSLVNIVLEGDKSYKSVVNHFKDIDKFTWGLRPQGTIDYNNGLVESKVSLRYNGSTHKTPIWNVNTYDLPTGVNRVEVKGGINSTTGVQYSGSWDDIALQQAENIKVFTISDASLNSNSLCNTMAESIGERESTETTTIQFNVRDADVGFIQPSQNIMLEYLSQDVNIPLDQLIIDRIVLSVKAEILFIEASTGLVFEYKRNSPLENLVEENSQLILQNAREITSVSGGSVTQTDINDFLSITDINALDHLTITDINALNHLTITDINALNHLTITDINTLNHLTQTDINDFLSITDINALNHLTQTDINDFLSITDINTLNHLTQTDINGFLTQTEVNTSAVSAVATADHYVKNIGDAMTGALAMGTNKITGMGDPDDNQDASTKKYVDDSTIATLTLQQVSDHGAVTTTVCTFNGGLTLGGNLVMGANNITLDATQTVDGVDVSTFKTAYDTHVSSANTHIADDTIHYVYPIKDLSPSEKSTYATSFTKMKETRVVTAQTSVTFYWQHKRLNTAGTAYTKLYVNGGAVGVQKSTTSSTYVNVSDTITVAIGDLVQIYGYNSVGTPNGVAATNLYFYFQGGSQIL